MGCNVLLIIEYVGRIPEVWKGVSGVDERVQYIQKT
jgi:hypothetical protein